MALIIHQNKIEIYIPNSEANICAQHIGIKDRTVGQYYMSDSYEDVYTFLNQLEGEYYIDFHRSYYNMEEVYEYIRQTNKEDLFKSSLMDQYFTQSEILEKNLIHEYIKIQNPTINSNAKYIKLSKADTNIQLLQNLLLGDLSKIIIMKLSDKCFVIYGDKDENYKYKVDCSFKY